MNIIVKFTPFLTWIKELKNPEVLKADAFAGLTVALVLIPQSIAYAQLAGLPAQYGLYAAFLPVLIAAIMGSSRQLSTGPVAIVALLTAAALQPFAVNPETYIAYAFLLSILVGLFQLALGLLNLGWVINFLSHSVVIGFTNAAAIIIGASQLEKIFGVSKIATGRTYEQVWGVIVNAIHNTHLMTLVMAGIAFIAIFSIKKFFPKLPNILLAVVITTSISWFVNFGAAIEDGGLGGAIIGGIASGLPSVVIPSFSFDAISQMLLGAITISIVGFMEAISIAKAMAAQTKQRLNTNQELIGQGLANLVSGFSQGQPVSGSFARSAINIATGAITGFSSVVTAIIVGITILWLTPLIYHLPQATLAVIIITSVAKLIKFTPIMHSWKVERHDVFVSVVTFLLTLLFAPHLEIGIAIGVIFSLGLFLYRTMKPRFTELSAFDDDAKLINITDTASETSHEVISIVKYSGSLYFANAGYFEDKILKLIADKHQSLKYIIVDMESMNQIDASGEEILSSLVERCSTNKVEILFARIEEIEKILRSSGFIDKYGEERFHKRRSDALKYAWEQLEKEKLSSHKPLIHLVS